MDNRVKKQTNIILVFIMSVFGLAGILPYLLSISISFSDKATLVNEGFSFIPAKFSLEAYKALIAFGDQLVDAYVTTIFVTVVGTALALVITLTLGYVISRKDFVFRKPLTILIFFTMLFNPGLVPNYMVITQVLSLQDTVWALIVPLLINPFWILVARTFFQFTVPEEIIESAKIDGAGEFQSFIKIVLPVCLPLIATIALFGTLTYWNDWFNAQLYIDRPDLNSLQYLLNRIGENITFLQRNSTMLGAQASQTINAVSEQGLMMAMLAVATLPIAFAYPFFQKYLVSGLTVGSIK